MGLPDDNTVIIGKKPWKSYCIIMWLLFQEYDNLILRSSVNNLNTLEYLVRGFRRFGIEMVSREKKKIKMDSGKIVSIWEMEVRRIGALKAHMA